MGCMMSDELCLFHQPDDALAAHMNAFIVQLVMNAWTAVTPFVLLIKSENLSGDLAIFQLPCRGRPLEPGVEAAFRDAQHTAYDGDFPLSSVVLDKAKMVFYGCEKMASAFIEVGGQRGTDRCSDLSESTQTVSKARPFSNRPFPNLDVQLSLHPALQGGSSTGMGLMRHPPHPLGSIYLPLHPFPMYRALHAII
jgi:hypothetical protein